MESDAFALTNPRRGPEKCCIVRDQMNSHQHRRIEFLRKQQQEWTSMAGEEESRPQSKGGGWLAFGSDGVVDDVINSGTGTLPGVHQRLINHSWWKKGRAHHLDQRVARSTLSVLLAGELFLFDLTSFLPY